MSGFVAVAVADNDQVNVNDVGRFGAFAAGAFGRNQRGITTTVSPEDRKTLAVCQLKLSSGAVSPPDDKPVP